MVKFIDSVKKFWLDEVLWAKTRRQSSTTPAISATIVSSVMPADYYVHSQIHVVASLLLIVTVEKYMNLHVLCNLLAVAGPNIDTPSHTTDSVCHHPAYSRWLSLLPSPINFQDLPNNIGYLIAWPFLSVDTIQWFYQTLGAKTSTMAGVQTMPELEYQHENLCHWL